MEEDELAVHTIAAAAYGLLKDLKRDRGMSEAADSYQATYFYVVRDFRRGTLPAHMTSDPVMMVAIERIAEQLSQITADSKLSDVQVTISPDLEREYWNRNNQAANFLKHADRDSDGTLSLDQIDNRLLLLKCCLAYRDIAPDDLGYEGMAFEAFTAAGNPAHEETDSEFDSLVGSMRRVLIGQRLGLCYQLIVEMNET